MNTGIPRKLILDDLFTPLPEPEPEPPVVPCTLFEEITPTWQARSDAAKEEVEARVRLADPVLAKDCESYFRTGRFDYEAQELGLWEAALWYVHASARSPTKTAHKDAEALVYDLRFHTATREKMVEDILDDVADWEHDRLVEYVQDDKRIWLIDNDTTLDNIRSEHRSYFEY